MAPPKRKGGRTLPGTTSTAAAAGRVTKKPSAARIDDEAHAHHSGRSSSRYTPPIPREQKVSPRWVPIVMGALLIIGALMIVMNYLEVLPGAASNGYLLVGLLLILGGIVVATQWH